MAGRHDDEIAYAPIFGSTYEYAKALPETEAYKLLMACCAYAFGEGLPDLDGITLVVFEQTAKPSIDRALEKAKRNRQNGRKRVSAGANESHEGTSAAPPPPQTDANPNPTATQAQPKPNPDESQPEPNPNPNATQGKAKETQPMLRPMTNDQRPMTKEPKEHKGAKAPTRPRFTRPTVEEVREYSEAYCQKKGILPASFQPERFIDYYEANGWHVGKAPMRSWQAAVRNWLSKEPKKQEVSGSNDLFAAYE